MEGKVTWRTILGTDNRVETWAGHAGREYSGVRAKEGKSRNSEGH